MKIVANLVTLRILLLKCKTYGWHTALFLPKVTSCPDSMVARSHKQTTAEAAETKHKSCFAMNRYTNL